MRDIILFFLLTFLFSCKKKYNYENADSLFLVSSFVTIDKDLKLFNLFPEKKQSLDRNLSSSLDFDHRSTNHNFDYTKINSKKIVNFKPQFFHKLDVNFFSSPIIYDNKIFILYKNGDFNLYDLKTESNIWSGSALNSFFERFNFNNGHATLYFENKNPYIYLTTNNGYILKIDFLTGKEIFRKDYKNAFNSEILCSYQDFCYINSSSGKIYKINKINGEVLKEIDYESNIYSNLSNPTPILIGRDLIIFSLNSGQILGTDLNLNEKFNFQLRQNKTKNLSIEAKSINFAPVILGDVLVAGGSKLYTYGINLKSGDIIWIKNFSINSQIAKIDNFVIFFDEANRLNMVDGLTGNVKWSTQFSQFKQAEVPKYLNEGYNISAPILYHSPIIANDSLMIANYFGEFFIVDLNSGVIVEQKNIPYFINTAPIIINEKLYFTGASGQIYKSY